MTQEDKDILLRLLQQHKQLGVSGQIDYEKFYLYSIITHSAFVEMVDKWSIKPSLAEKMVDILAFVVDKNEITTESIVSHFGYPPTTAKRHLRQLTEFGYLQAHGGNKNRTYRGNGLLPK